MLYLIKALKAPWPEGAKVGDVVDMPYLPVWAQGKCSIAPDDAKATVEFPDPMQPGLLALTGDGSGTALPEIDAVNAEVEKLQVANAQLTAENAKLRDDLAAAQSDDGKAAAALKAADEQAAAEKADKTAKKKG